MDLAAIIAEVEGAAQQEAAGIAILETTHFEPELGLTAERCLASAKRRAEGLAAAARLLREHDLRPRCERARDNLGRFRDALIDLRDAPRPA